MAKLIGKVALITGSTSGIGAAGAGLFAREGARVIINGTNEQRGKEVLESIRDNGGEAEFIAADVSSTTELKRLVGGAVRRFGGLDVFWHNAGDAGPGRIDLVTEAQYDKTMALHLKAGFFGCQYAIPELIKRGGGSILLTGSGAVFKPLPGSPTYSIVKGGLAMLARCLAPQLGPENIRVNCICPGPTETELRREVMARHPDLVDPDVLDRANVAATPLGRVSKPEEIARVALFMVSDDASYMTGAVVLVDGGLVAGPPADWLRITSGPSSVANTEDAQ